eukprot:gb/GFBE01054493.1/.p1 GENE.gb/GFBE01054493.1/~~gb/GFBE01054493.1/.p1  ORF type:complete len:261 (+),score=65.78 gb/GFBE01054493.1/:1-783(+)
MFAYCCSDGKDETQKPEKPAVQSPWTEEITAASPSLAEQNPTVEEPAKEPEAQVEQPIQEPPAPEPEKEAPTGCAAAAPKASLVTYTALLDVETNGSLGLNIDVQDEHFAIVSRVNGAAAGTWNAMCPDAESIQAGDCISEVAGKPVEPKTLLSLIAAAKETRQPFQVMFCRPCVKMVNITKNGRPLGLKATDLETNFGMSVNAVEDGPIKEWNLSNPSSAVTKYDRIVGVNGQSGSVAQLVQLMKSSEQLELKVLSWNP